MKLSIKILIAVTMILCIIGSAYAATSRDWGPAGQHAGIGNSTVAAPRNWGSEGQHAGIAISTEATPRASSTQVASTQQTTEVMTFTSIPTTGTCLDNSEKAAVYMPAMTTPVYSESTGTVINTSVTYDRLTTSMFFEYNPDYLSDFNIASNLTTSNYNILIVPMQQMSDAAASAINSYISNGGSVWFLNDPCLTPTSSTSANRITILGTGISATVSGSTTFSVVNTDDITYGLPTSFKPVGTTSKTSYFRSLSGSGTISGMNYQVLMGSGTSAMLIKFENPTTGARVIYSNPNMFISGGTSSYFNAQTATKLFLQTKAWVMKLAQNPSGIEITFPNSDKQFIITCDDPEAAAEEGTSMDTMFNMEKAHGLTPSIVNTLFIIPSGYTVASELAYYAQNGDIHTLHPHLSDDNSTGSIWDTVSKSITAYQSDITTSKSIINTLMGTSDYGYASWRFPMTTFCANSTQAVSNSGFTIESSCGIGTDSIRLGNSQDNTVLFPKQVLVNNVKSNLIEMELPDNFDINCASGTDFYNRYNAFTSQFKNVNFPANFVVGCHYQGAGVNGLPEWGVTAKNLTEGLGQIIDAEKAANPSYANFNTLTNYTNGIKSAKITASTSGDTTTVTVVNTKPITNFTIKVALGTTISATCDGSSVSVKKDDLTSSSYITKNISAGTHEFVINKLILPKADFNTNASSGYAPLAVQFYDTSTDATGWNWNFGDGGNSTQKSPMHTYLTAGTYTVNLTVNNTNGTDSKLATLIVLEEAAPPVANFSSNVTQGSAPFTVQFTDLSKNAVEWNWNFGDGGSSTQRSPMHTYLTAGNYTVNLTVSKAYSTDSKLATINVSRKTLVSIVYDDNEVGQAEILNSKGVQGTIAFVTRDIIPDEDLEYMHILENTGWEIASHSVNHGTEAEYEFKDSKDYLMNQGFNVEGFVVPLGGPLNDTQREWARKYYKWSRDGIDFSLGSPVTNYTVFCNYPPIDPYHLMGVGPTGQSVSDLEKLVDAADKNHYWMILELHYATMTDSDLSALIDYIKAKQIDILPITKAFNIYNPVPILPVANFSSNVSSGYVPLSVQFNDSSKNATNWNWNFGDGGNSTQQNPMHTYLSAGNYTVNLTVNNTNDTDSKLATINVSEKPVPILPVANFSSNVSSGYVPLSVQFNDSSKNVTNWNWNFGDGGNSTQQNPMHTYLSAGNYTVNLTVNNTNGNDSKLATINVSEKPVPIFPVANFSSNVSSGYVPLSVQFNDSSKNATNWNWNFGDGGNSTQQNPMHTYLSAGNYTVNLTVNNTNGTDSKLAKITVFEKPIMAEKALVSFVFDDNQVGQAEILNSKGVQGTVAFVTRDVLPADLPYIHELENAGWEIASHSVNHEIEAESEFKDSKDYLVNQGFKVEGFATPYGGPLNATQDEWAHKYYTWVRDGVEFSPSQTANYSDFCNHPPINTYHLIGVGPNGHNLSDLEQLVDAANENHYWIIWVLQRNSLTDSDLSALIDYTKAKQIDILPVTKAFNIYESPGLPVANFSSNVSSGYAPLSVQFNDSSKNATDWNWNFGDGTNSTEQNPEHTYSTAGNYTVNLTVSNANGTDSKLAKITVFEKPIMAEKALVSFVFDDNQVGQAEILNSKGVQGTVAFVTRDVLPADLPYIHELENAGWEIASHSVNHEIEAESEFKDSKDYLVNQGFKVEGFATPYGGPLNATQDEWAHKYYTWVRDGVEFSPSQTANYSDFCNHPPINTYHLIGVGPNGHNLSDLEQLVDAANENHYWIIWVLQRNSLTDSDLSALIDYTKAKQIDILPVTKAFNIYELPVANFSSSVSGGYAPLYVQFNDSSKNATEWNWNFGDGSNSTQQSPMHTYLTAGTYTVNQTVNNTNGTDSKLDTINALKAYAYITNRDSNTVSVIDSATNKVTATVKVGNKPQGVAVNPTGTEVYVANQDSNTVSVIDSATDKVTATVKVGNKPQGVAVNPTGTKVYVANRDSNTVSVIDSATNKVTATVKVRKQASRSCGQPDRNKSICGEPRQQHCLCD